MILGFPNKSIIDSQVSQRPIPQNYMNEQHSRWASWNTPKTLLALHDDPKLVIKPLQNPPATAMTYKSLTVEGMEVEEEEAAREVEEQEQEQDQENSQIAKGRTAAQVSIEKNTNLFAFLFFKILIKLKANKFFRSHQ